MWGRAMGGARLLPLLPLLLLLPTGSVGLQCLSCGSQDGRCPEATNVTCPPDSDVCAEALAAVTWSHGRFALGGRGCGRGQPGAIARALELLGLVVFERRRHCGGGACNHHLPLGQQGALPLPANSSDRTPNGLECFGCPEEGPCPPTTVVQCYGDLRGCFHGNVTLRLGNVTMWRELRGCVRDGSCSREWRGDDAASLSGSCCSGNLCNRHLADRTLFDPDLPRLELLPHGHAPTATPKMADNATAAPAGTQNVTADSGATAQPGVAVPDPSRATGDKRAARERGKMAAGDKMAAGEGGKTATADGDKMATGEGDKTATGDGDKMATGEGDKMAAGEGGKMAADDEDKMAAGEGGKMAAGDKMATSDGNKMAAGDKMAGGRQGRKDGIKGPSGRGHPLEGPGWLLPFLLLPLLR